MANVDVGGVTAELAIGFSDWSRGLQEAIRDLQQFSATLTQLMGRLDTKTTSTSEDMAKAMREMGKTIADSIREASRDTSREASRMSVALEDLGEQARETSREVDQSLSGTLVPAVRETSRDTTREVGKMTDSVMTLKKRISEVGPEASQALTGLGQKMMGASAVVAAALTGIGAASLSAASEIEGYQVQLETLTGSAEQAQKKLSYFRDLAVTSPFSLKELVESGVALEAYGQQAEKWLPRVGDFAASMNLDVTEAARGIGKALAGSAEGWEILRNAGVNGKRLAPFGAVLTREGNVDPNDPRNAQALLGFLDSLEGTSQKKSETIEGRFSMVGDAIFNTFADVGDAIAPYAKAIADAATMVITAVGQLPSAVLVAGGVLAGLGAALAGLGGAVLLMAPGIAALPASFAALSAAITPIAPVLAGVAVAVVALGAASAALAVAWAKNWGGIRETVSSFVDQTKTFLAGFWPQVVRGFDALRLTVAGVWGQLWDGASQRWSAFRAEIEPGLVAVRDFFGRIWPDIQHIVDMALAVLVPMVGDSFDALVQKLTLAAKVLSAVWSGLWSGIKASYEIAWIAVSGIIESNLKMLRGIFQSILMALSGDWSGAWTALTTAAQDSFQVMQSSLGAALGRIGEALWNFIPTVAEAGWNIGKALWDAIRSAVSSEGSDLSGIQAAASGRGMTAQAGSYFSAWYSGTMTAGAEQRRREAQQARVVEQQSYWASRQSRGRDRQQSAPTPTPATTAVPGASPGAAPRATTPAQRILAESQKRVGTAFLPGQVAQCANFVRDVYAAAGVKVGTSQSPMDIAQTRGLPQGPGYANSFFGADVGQIIRDLSALKVGDVVGYQNTYGAYQPGTITHAAIYAGNGMVIHRGTREGSVTQVPMESLGRVAYGVRPFALGGDATVAKMDEKKREYESIGTETARRMGEQVARQMQYLEEMSSQRIELMASDTERERAELDKRFGDMVAYWERVKVQTPGIAAEAEQQIALVRQAQLERTAELERAQWQRRHDEALADQEWQVQMGRQTHEELTAFLARQLEAWQGTEEGKRALMLQYREAFSADLDAMREAQSTFDEEDLARMAEVLQAKTELTVAERIRLDELLAELDAARNEKMLEWQGIAQSVSQAFEGAFTSAFVGVLTGQQSFAAGMKAIWQSLVQTILAEIAKVIAKLLALKALQMLTGFFFPVGSVGGGVGGNLGSSISNIIPSFHEGGVVGRNPGLRSDEVLAKLQRGEVVLSRDTVRGLQSSAAGEPSSGVNLTIQNLHNHGPQDVAMMARDLGRRTAWYLQGA